MDKNRLIDDSFRSEWVKGNDLDEVLFAHFLEMICWEFDAFRSILEVCDFSNLVVLDSFLHSASGFHYVVFFSVSIVFVKGIFS